MDCFFFGERATQLFGAYHAPPAAADRRQAVLICPPIGQAYLRAHRSLRRLAEQLAAAGFHTLRFDYYATGDSAGSSESGSISQWLADIDQAVSELCDNSGCQDVTILGLRLGGSLAALYAAENRSVTSLVLWEPVIDGKAYLTELRQLHQQWKADQLQLPSAEPSLPAQMLGFPFSRTMSEEIAAVQLNGIARPPAEAILLLSNSGGAALTALQDRWRMDDHTISLETIGERKIWLKKSSGSGALVAGKSQRAIIEWLTGNRH